jgi:hypothetical protein
MIRTAVVRNTKVRWATCRTQKIGEFAQAVDALTTVSATTTASVAAMIRSAQGHMPIAGGSLVGKRTFLIYKKKLYNRMQNVVSELLGFTAARRPLR